MELALTIFIILIAITLIYSVMTLTKKDKERCYCQGCRGPYGCRGCKDCAMCRGCQGPKGCLGCPMCSRMRICPCCQGMKMK